jgi:hypothetical protein
MHPPSSKPMEVAAVACRAGLLARARPGSRARRRAWEHGVAVGPAPSAARRRLLVASQSLDEEEAVALEVIRCRRLAVTTSFDREFAITHSHNCMKSIDFGVGG